MELLAFLISAALGGLIVGALARLAIPGRDPMSIWRTMLLGILGSLVSRGLVPEHGVFGYGASGARILDMCRNIRTLHNFEPPAAEDEVRDAALQYVRKISGYTKPSQVNKQAFARAVDAIADASARLLEELTTSAPPRDRELEAARRRVRAEARFGATVS